MFEMALLEPSKETENKLRWSTFVEEDDTDFQLYIPKWRVPEPWPGLILASIASIEETSIELLESDRPKDMEAPILVALEPSVEHTKTIRYKPLGNNKNDWQTGEPYIPYSLIPPGSHHLLLRVFVSIENGATC